MSTVRSRHATVVCSVATAALACFTACEASDGVVADRRVARAPTGQLAALTAADGPTCAPSDAHGKHESVGYGCTVCHRCGGTVEFGDLTLPGGSGTADGTIVRDGSASTCSVECHGPLGARSPPVAWNAGPLACTACHTNVAVAGSATRSSHFAATATPGGSCEGCHDRSGHTRGEVRLLNGDGTSAASTCTGCHAGQGQTLAGETPPLLVGWSDAASGDFHGARPGTCRFDQLDGAGATIGTRGGLECPPNQPAPPNALRITSRWAPTPAGPWAWTCDLDVVDASGTRLEPTLSRQPCPPGTYLNSACPTTPSSCHPTTHVTRGHGGTLLPPHVRGQGPLPCDSCHDPHSSTNSFLIAAVVNGAPIPPGAIDRAGVGGEALCEACHEGDRHGLCKSCHRAWKISEDGVEYFDPAAPAVDPAPPGSPCFWCHGHEGIRHYTAPDAGNHHGSTRFDVGCNHCHGFGQPPTEYVAPVVQGAGAFAVTATTATLSWRTNEGATSYVEYGIGTAGWIAGNDDLVGQHVVTLTGLSPGTRYVWRVRTSDQFRNVSETALESFSTPRADEVPRPDLATVWAGATVPATTTVGTLRWHPVSAPSGEAVEYEVQLASDPVFASLVNAQLVRIDESLATGNSGWIAGAEAGSSGSPARPALGFGVTFTNLPQDDCMDVQPNVYYFRVRARDALGNVSEWSGTGVFGVMAGDPWC